MCWSIVTFLLVLSLTNSDFVDLVLEVVVAFVLAVQSARVCSHARAPRHAYCNPTAFSFLEVQQILYLDSLGHGPFHARRFVD
jgi:hypothetical protein